MFIFESRFYQFYKIICLAVTTNSFLESCTSLTRTITVFGGNMANQGLYSKFTELTDNFQKLLGKNLIASIGLSPVVHKEVIDFLIFTMQ